MIGREPGFSPRLLFAPPLACPNCLQVFPTFAHACGRLRELRLASPAKVVHRSAQARRWTAASGPRAEPHTPIWLHAPPLWRSKTRLGLARWPQLYDLSRACRGTLSAFSDNTPVDAEDSARRLSATRTRPIGSRVANPRHGQFSCDARRRAPTPGAAQRKRVGRLPPFRTEGGGSPFPGGSGLAARPLLHPGRRDRVRASPTTGITSSRCFVRPANVTSSKLTSEARPDGPFCREREPCGMADAAKPSQRGHAVMPFRIRKPPLRRPLPDQANISTNCLTLAETRQSRGRAERPAPGRFWQDHTSLSME